LLERRVDTVATNGVHWGTRSALVATLSHFLKLGTEQELLGSGHNMDLTQGQVDALKIQERPASDLLASHVFPSVAHGSPDGTEE
jgi:hypothetical protein